jgi:hypothetical protein
MRIQRLERAQLAAERQRMKSRSGSIDVDIHDSDSEGIRMNLDVRYEIPMSRKAPVNLYNFVRAHRRDPAIDVSHPFEL